MRLPSAVAVCAAWIFAIIPSALAQSTSTITVYAWPLSAASPTPFAKLVLESPSTASVVSLALPETKGDEVVRVGLYDAKTKSWSGVAAAAEAFREDARKKLVLHVDEDGHAYHVGYGMIPKKDDAGQKQKKERKKKREKPKSQKALEREERERQRELKRRKKKGLPVVDEEPFVVEVVQKQEGPRPILNKPVVLNAEGKIDGPPEGDNRTFLQKYWWVLVGFLVIQVLAGGGGDK